SVTATQVTVLMVCLLGEGSLHARLSRQGKIKHPARRVVKAPHRPTERPAGPNVRGSSNARASSDPASMRVSSPCSRTSVSWSAPRRGPANTRSQRRATPPSRRCSRSAPGADDGLSRRAEHYPLAVPAVDLEPLAGPIHRHRERGGRLGRIDPERLLGARELRLTPPTDVRECLLHIGPGVRVDLES